MKYGHRLGDAHVRRAHVLRHALAETRRDLVPPGAGDVQQPRGADLDTARRGYAKSRAVVLDRRHRRVLANVGAGRPRGAGERGPDESRVGLTVIGAERPADRGIPEIGIARMKLVATKQFELQPIRAHGLAIGFELGDVRIGASELDVAARHELAIAADDLGESRPTFRASAARAAARPGRGLAGARRRS